MHGFCKIKDANATMRTCSDVWAQLKKLSAVEKLVHVGARDGVPPSCFEACVLLNNLGTLHLHLATKVEGDHQSKSMTECHRYKKLAIERMEERHSEFTNQKDRDYIQMVYHSLNTPGLTEEG